MERTELAWAAGFIEAEGCFSATKVNKVVTITQVDLEPLNVFYNTVQIGTLKGPYNKATAAIRRRPQWIWYAYGKNALAVFELVRPWFGDYRDEQAQRALRQCASLPQRVPFEQWTWAEKVAWCGGFFEGEGCFSRAGRSLTARLANTDLELVERVHSTIGTGHVYGPYTSAGRSYRKKPQYVFTTSGFEEMQAILAMLWPWLSSRRRLTAMALLDDYLNYYICGCERDPSRWRKNCQKCFKPGPRTGELALLRKAVQERGSSTPSITARLQKTGQVFIPRSVRKELRLTGGDVLTFRTTGPQIAAERCRRGLPETARLSSKMARRGLVSIPLPIRRQAELRPGDMIRLCVKGRLLVLQRADPAS
ncbi:MAG: hypothetical protein ACREA0_04965 [bacterium]